MLFNIRDLSVIFYKLILKGHNSNVVRVEKHSDTLFILGTGTTINELTSEHFRIINKHDSFGFNFFLLHDFIPRFYMFEYIRDDEMRAIWLNNIDKYRNAEGPELLIVPQSAYNKIEAGYPEMYDVVKKLERLNIIRNCQVGIENTSSLSLLYSLRDMFYKNTYLHLRGSLTMALEFAFKCDYKNIVLCGIDLDDKGYFYNSLVNNKDVGKPNSTVMPGKQGLTMDINLRFLINRYKNINFFVSSPNSKVAEFAEVVNWDKFDI